VDLAEKVFKMPLVRCAETTVSLGESLAMPAFSTGVGLLCYAARDKKKNKRETGANKIVGSVGNAISRFWNFIKNYI
jgi:cell division protein FtsA